MTENEIASVVVDVAYKVHTTLGPGLLENVYEIVLVHELRRRGLAVARQVPISIKYDSIQFDEGFRADIIVEDKVILEIKSIEEGSFGSQETVVDLSSLNQQTAWLAH